MIPIKDHYHDVTIEAQRHGYWSGIGVIMAHTSGEDVLLLVEDGILHIWPDLDHVRGRSFCHLSSSEVQILRSSECLFEDVNVWY